MTNQDIVGEDHHGHGTNILKAIGTQIGKGDYCFLVYKVNDLGPDDPSFKPDIKSTPTRFAAAILRATDQGANIINISAGGEGYDENEHQAMMYAVAHRVKIFVAAGNEHKNLDKECVYFSACYKLPGVEVVGAIDIKERKPALYSDYGDVVTIWQDGEFDDMHGTSQATAIACGLYVKILLKGNFYDFPNRSIAGRRV